MSGRRPRIATLAALVVTLVSCGGRTPTAVDTAYFDRPTASPPQPAIRYEDEQPGGVVVQSITYPGSTGDVGAFLVLPPGAGPHPAVLYLHEGRGSKYSFLDEAVRLAGSGVVALLVDAPYARTADHYRSVLFDLWIGLDLLATTPQVDPKRIAYVGHSWGAAFGPLLAVLDGRPVGYVLIAGVPSFSEFFDDESFAPFDTADYIGEVTRPVFLQVAADDEAITREMSDRLSGAASEPKQTVTYDTTHSFDDTGAAADRIDWLLNLLGRS